MSLAALDAAGTDNLAGKVVVDVSNPLDFSQGMPPTLTVCNTDSVAEQIQARFPAARVVKTLNTVNADVMVHPEIVPGGHTMFLCGNDAGAKADVRALLESFGWPAADLLDLGDIAGARGIEMYLPLWLRLWGATGTGHLNIKVQTGRASESLRLQQARVGGDVDRVLLQGGEGHDVERPLVGRRQHHERRPPRRDGPAASWRR